MSLFEKVEVTVLLIGIVILLVSAVKLVLMAREMKRELREWEERRARRP